MKHFIFLLVSILLSTLSIADNHLAINDNNKSLNIDPKKSWAKVLVYKTGFLSRLGHNHTVSINVISGSINLATPLSKSTASLTFKVHNLEVDNSDDRTKAGALFDGDISQSDKDGTMENMLGKYVLNAAKYPTISLSVVSVDGDMDNLKLLTDITIQNITLRKSIPAKGLWVDKRFNISGSFAILQSDFKIEPFSILGGAIAVQDKLDIQFKIVTKQTKGSRA